MTRFAVMWEEWASGWQHIGSTACQARIVGRVGDAVCGVNARVGHRMGYQAERERLVTAIS